MMRDEESLFVYSARRWGVWDHDQMYMDLERVIQCIASLKRHYSALAEAPQCKMAALEKKHEVRS